MAPVGHIKSQKTQPPLHSTWDWPGGGHINGIQRRVIYIDVTFRIITLIPNKKFKIYIDFFYCSSYQMTVIKIQMKNQ